MKTDRLHPLGLINWMMYFISQKYTDFQNILLIDELHPAKEIENGPQVADWSALDTFRSNIDLLIALSPQGVGFQGKFQVIPPTSDNVLSQQLMTRHRNGYENAIMLEALKHCPGDSYLDPINDTELDAAKLPNARLPVWIERGSDVPDIEVLEKIKSDFIYPHESVILIYSERVI